MMTESPAKWTLNAALFNISQNLVEKPNFLMGLARKYAEMMNLSRAIPRPDLASCGYCLAETGEDYLLYVPGGEQVEVELGDGQGEWLLEWVHPQEGWQITSRVKQEGSRMAFDNPYVEAALLHMKKS